MTSMSGVHRSSKNSESHNISKHYGFSVLERYSWHILPKFERAHIHGALFCRQNAVFCFCGGQLSDHHKGCTSLGASCSELPSTLRPFCCNPGTILPEPRPQTFESLPMSGWAAGDVASKTSNKERKNNHWLNKPTAYAQR